MQKARDNKRINRSSNDHRALGWKTLAKLTQTLRTRLSCTLSGSHVVHMEDDRNNQFTLKRLFIAITILAAVLGFTTAYPVIAAKFTTKLLIATPSLTVLLIACWLSSARRRTLITVDLAILVGWLLSPVIFVSWGRIPTFWDYFILDFWNVGMYMFGAAIVGGIADWVYNQFSNHILRENVG